MRFVSHKYQQNVINHILSHHGTGVFLDMGLGKTAITLMAILIEIYDLLEVDKVLIIAPKKGGGGYLAGRGSQVGGFQGLTHQYRTGDGKAAYKGFGHGG